MKMQQSKLKESLYLVCVCITYNIEGGHFVVIPTAYAKLFGPDGGFRAFSIGFTFLIAAALVNIVANTFFLDDSGIYKLGFSGICSLHFVLGVIALLLLFCYKEDKVDFVK